MTETKKAAAKKGRPKLQNGSTKNATYRIPNDLYEKLSEDANKNRRSIAQQLVYILEEYFTKKDNPDK